MNNSPKIASFDLRRVATCATLATLTSLGIFSLIANVMPPLVADGPVLASSHEAECLPTAQAPEAARHARHSAI